MKLEIPQLTDEERAIYEWQIWSDGIGEEGQRRLKAASVMISRCGGVGGTAAYHLAAAGIGRLILAHAGDIKPSDLNRQLLMTHAALGTSRLDSAKRRLTELNPRLHIEAIAENVSEANADRLVAAADVVIDAAPLFQERLAMNRAAVNLNKPMVDAAMYDFELQLTTFLPGRTPCLACLCPEPPPTWKRQFPVFSAVSGTAGAMAAAEVIKLITGVGHPLAGRLLLADLRSMEFRTMKIARRPECLVCGGLVVSG